MVIPLSLLLIATLVRGDKGRNQTKRVWLLKQTLTHSADVNVFLESPEPSLSSLHSFISFSCSVVASEVTEVLWEVDGGQTSSKSYAEVLRERGLQWRYYKDGLETNLQLTVLASEENNDTQIVCVAFTVTSGIIKTPPVNLYVYGT